MKVTFRMLLDQARFLKRMGWSKLKSRYYLKHWIDWIENYDLQGR